MTNRLSAKMVIKMMSKAAGAQGDVFMPSKLKTLFQKEKTKTGTSFSQLMKKKEINIGDFKSIYQKAQEQGIVKKSLPTAEKQAEMLQEAQRQEGVEQARKETMRAERWRGAALGGEKAIRGMERVYAGGEKYRKQQAATSGLLKSRGGGGMAAERKSEGLLNKAMEEEKDEKNSPKGSKSGQKGGGSVLADQKSGGHQPVKLQGSAGIDQLTHRQEITKGENLPGGVYHVEGLDKTPVSPPEARLPLRSEASAKGGQSETPPASAPKDPDELNI